MRHPAWFLLLWSALVASLVAAWLGFAARGRLHDHRPIRSAVATLGLGILVYGPLYGLLFEAIGTATLLVGAVIGAFHGAAVASIALLRDRLAGRGPRSDDAAVHGRRLVIRLVYGAILGLLYVVPPA
ncbi:MAG: hypothetical protein ACRELX_05915, partial [Longimicrobiales bacterium]